MTLRTDGVRPLRAAALAACFALAALLAESSASAYPQWQFSTGETRCSNCHFAPTGGGLVTSYAREEVGESLSTFRGNGALLHGALELPRWLALGGDARFALVGNQVQDPGGAQLAAFPMQADLYGRVALPRAFSLYGSGGLRGQVRDPGAIVPDQNYQPITASRLVSREHWAMWQPATIGPYARVGRFYAPFGLRMAEHLLYTRRDLGFNYMEESYNVSGGYVTDRWDAHLTAFAPDFLRHMGGTESGAAGYFEHHVLEDTGALAAQAKVAVGEGRTRYIAGGVAKLYFERWRTLLLAEADFVHNVYQTGAGHDEQLLGMAGASWLPTRGVLGTLLIERNQTDLRVRQSAWSAVNLFASWFPYAHVEVQLVGRVQIPEGGVAAETVLAQLHYFL